VCFGMELAPRTSLYLMELDKAGSLVLFYSVFIMMDYYADLGTVELAVALGMFLLVHWHMPMTLPNLLLLLVVCENYLLYANRMLPSII
jgi:hypothetical protein